MDSHVVKSYTDLIILPTFQESTSIRDINLMSNDIGPEGGEILARALQVLGISIE